MAVLVPDGGPAPDQSPWHGSPCVQGRASQQLSTSWVRTRAIQAPAKCDGPASVQWVTPDSPCPGDSGLGDGPDTMAILTWSAQRLAQADPPDIRESRRHD